MAKKANKAQKIQPSKPRGEAPNPPKYVTVHAAVKAAGAATVPALSEKLGLEPTQVTGALVTLSKIGAVRRRARGEWEALEMPAGYPKTRGRPLDEGSARSRVLQHLQSEGASQLGSIVDALAGNAPADERKKVRAQASHALLQLVRAGAVRSTGSRGTYAYEVAS